MVYYIMSIDMNCPLIWTVQSGGLFIGTSIDFMICLWFTGYLFCWYLSSDMVHCVKHLYKFRYFFTKSLLIHFICFDWQASKKKVYMLYNLEPDRSVTGGAWYSDQDFESEFVEVLNQQCFKYLEQRVSLTEDWYSTGISSVKRNEQMFSCIIMVNYCMCRGCTIHRCIVKCN